MEPLALIRQAALFAHAIAFAIALSAVLREDLALIVRRRIDMPRLAATARTLTIALAALWLTGVALLLLDVGLDARAVAASPKLAAKLVVVAALTANGVALHSLAFPMLAARDASRLMLPIVLGAISTASWLYASFIGLSRVVAPALRFGDFIAMYGALLVAAVAVALLFVRPRVAARRRLVANVQDATPRRSHTSALVRAARARSSWSIR